MNHSYLSTTFTLSQASKKFEETSEVLHYTIFHYVKCLKNFEEKRFKTESWTTGLRTAPFAYEVLKGNIIEEQDHKKVKTSK